MHQFCHDLPSKYFEQSILSRRPHAEASCYGHQSTLMAGMRVLLLHQDVVRELYRTSQTILCGARLLVQKTKISLLPETEAILRRMKNMKTTTQSKIAIAALGVMTASTFGGVTAAHAGSKGRLNTTLGLGAITAYGLLKGNKTAAIAGGLGTVYAYSKYNSAKKDEKADEARRVQWYQQRYGNSWRNHYARGR
jgi:hypothetical protein